MTSLRSEQVILSAPMSYAGSTRRIWRELRPPIISLHGQTAMVACDRAYG